MPLKEIISESITSEELNNFDILMFLLLEFEI